MRLKELSDYKNKIISKIIDNENLVKALSNNTEDFLDQPLISDVTSIIYKNVFPYKYIPSAQETASSYITMAFTNFSPQNREFKVGNIYFYIICHNNLLKTNYGCLRYDYIVNLIDEIFNDTGNISIGDFKFDSMSDFQVDSNHIGCWICYEARSFN